MFLAEELYCDNYPCRNPALKCFHVSKFLLEMVFVVEFCRNSHVDQGAEDNHCGKNLEIPGSARIARAIGRVERFLTPRAAIKHQKINSLSVIEMEETELLIFAAATNIASLSALSRSQLSAEGAIPAKSS